MGTVTTATVKEATGTAVKIATATEIGTETEIVTATGTGSATAAAATATVVTEMGAGGKEMIGGATETGETGGVGRGGTGKGETGGVERGGTGKGETGGLGRGGTGKGETGGVGRGGTGKGETGGVGRGGTETGKMIALLFLIHQNVERAGGTTNGGKNQHISRIIHATTAPRQACLCRQSRAYQRLVQAQGWRGTFTDACVNLASTVCQQLRDSHCTYTIKTVVIMSQ